MKKLIATFIILISSYSSYAASGQAYLRLDYGMGQFSSLKYDSVNAKPNGSTMSAFIGTKIRYLELGLFYKKMSFAADINHDGVANKIIYDGKAFGIDMSVLLTNHLSLKVGYAVNTYKEKLETDVNVPALNAIKSIYGLEDNFMKSNVFYGANIDLLGSRKYDIYASILHFPLGDSKSITTAQMGLRIYFDSNFSDYIGVN